MKEELPWQQKVLNRRSDNMAKYVKTNMGLIPLEDYLDIRARQYGFDSYKDLKEEGLSLDVSSSDIVEE